MSDVFKVYDTIYLRYVGDSYGDVDAAQAAAEALTSSTGRLHQVRSVAVSSDTADLIATGPTFATDGTDYELELEVKPGTTLPDWASLVDGKLGLASGFYGGAFKFAGTSDYSDTDTPTGTVVVHVEGWIERNIVDGGSEVGFGSKSFGGAPAEVVSFGPLKTITTVDQTFDDGVVRFTARATDDGDPQVVDGQTEIQLGFTLTRLGDMVEPELPE